MKAAWYEKNGTAKEVLKFGELDKPSPSPGEVLVRIVTSGVNPSDVKSRRAKPLSGPRVIPHSDGAGIVEAVGAGVDSNRVGERVWLWNAQWMREHGSASEFIALSGDQAVRMPDSLDFGGAACLGIPALTALQAVRLCGPMKDRDVLITGAGSAVGHYASQIALARGARVIGTVGSNERAAHARAVGVLHQIANSLATRQICTKGPGQTDLVWTYFGFADDDEEMTQRRLVQTNLAGSAGMISVEDAAVCGMMQHAMADAQEGESFIEMGGKELDIKGSNKLSERAIRNFWNHYRMDTGL